MMLVQKESNATFMISIDGTPAVLLEEFFALLLAMRDQFISSQYTDLEMFQQMICTMTAQDSEVWQMESENGGKAK